MSSSSHSNTVGDKYPGGGRHRERDPSLCWHRTLCPTYLPGHSITPPEKWKERDQTPRSTRGATFGGSSIEGVGAPPASALPTRPATQGSASGLYWGPMEAHLVAIWLTSVSVPLEDKLIPRPKAPAQVTCCYGPKPHLNLFAGVVQSPRGK